MRVREGGFAFDVEPVRNPDTLVLEKYRVRVFKLKPIEEVIYEGDADSPQAAQKLGERELAKALKKPDRAA